MSGLLERLDEGAVLVADGAMGTMLLQRGLQPGDCPELVNLDRPEVLGEIAAAYLAAGADIVQTNTFGAHPLKLAHYSLEDRAEGIVQAAVGAVREAVGQRALVSGSCGPCGEVLQPYGEADPEEVSAGFRLQAAALIAAGVDLLCIETMTDLAEATLAVEAARSVSATIPILATMTFDPTPKGFFTIMGVDVPRAARGLAEAGANAIGSNCGNGIQDMVRIAEDFRRETALPLVIQANAGLPELVGGKPTYTESPQFMGERCAALMDAGVRIIGGCCGTTPEHVAALRAAVDRRSG